MLPGRPWSHSLYGYRRREFAGILLQWPCPVARGRAHRMDKYGDLACRRALFDRISPVRHAGRIQEPLLVPHRTRDPRVAITEGGQVAAAVRVRGRGGHL